MTNYLLLVAYILLNFTCFFGTTLCIWWWRKNKWNASRMYIYLTALLFAIGVRNVIDMLIFWDRALFPGKPDHFLWIWESWLWPFRIIFLLVVTSFIVWHMARRVFFPHAGTTEEQEEDRRYEEAQSSSKAMSDSIISGLKEFKIFQKLVEKLGRRKGRL